MVEDIAGRAEGQQTTAGPSTAQAANARPAPLRMTDLVEVQEAE